MTIYEIDNQPWQVVRDLLVLDLWEAARTWPQPWTAWGGGQEDALVCLVERMITALLVNPNVTNLVPKVFDLEEGSDPRELQGADEDPDRLRAGRWLDMLLRGEGAAPPYKNELTVDFPGLVAELLGEEKHTRNLPGQVAGLAYRLDRIRLTPFLGSPGVNLQWESRPEGPALSCDLRFDARGVEVLAPFEVDWNRIEVRLDLIPYVAGERLLWRHQLLLTLEPESAGGAIEHGIQARLRKTVDEFLEAWGPLLTGVLLALPLRPVRDAFQAFETENRIELGVRLFNQMYPSAPTATGDVASAIVDSCLLPANPFRAISVGQNEAGLPDPALVDVFRARFGDHYVRHAANPVMADRRTVRFDVEPLPGGAGGDLATAAYGRWFAQTAANPTPGSFVPAVVAREQYRIALDRLVIPKRAMDLVPLGFKHWHIDWRVRVRHGSLAGNQWTTLARWESVPAVDGRVVTIGPSDVHMAWLEVGGWVRVAGQLRANGQSVCWFDVGAPVTAHGILGIGGPGGTLGVLPNLADGAGAAPPPELEADPPGLFRASALVRAEQQTSLRRGMLEWLTVKVRYVRRPFLNWPKDSPDPLGKVSPWAKLWLELRVQGQVAATRELTGEEAADLRHGDRATVEAPTTDVYVGAGEPDPVLEVTVAVLGADGDTMTELTTATFALTRDDPDHPDLRWGIHPSVGVRPVFVRADDDPLHVRVDVTDQHFDSAEVPLDQVPRTVRLNVHDIDVLQPTEPFGANIGSMWFDATFRSVRDGIEFGEVGPFPLGPFSHPTHAATPAIPVVVADHFVQALGGGKTAKLLLPEGAVLQVDLDGAEVPLWPAAPIPLGVARAVRLYGPAEDIGSEPWAPSGISEDGHFRFRVVASGTKPPPPRFDPLGTFALNPQATVELVLPPLAKLEFAFGCVPWATQLRLRRRTDEAGSKWSNIGDALPIDVAGDAALEVPEAGTWLYALRARNSTGDTLSRLLRITVDTA